MSVLGSTSRIIEQSLLNWLEIKAEFTLIMDADDYLVVENPSVLKILNLISLM